MAARSKATTIASAKKYIDGVLDLNARMGQKATVPPDTYERAVKQAASAFKNVNVKKR